MQEQFKPPGRRRRLARIVLVVVVALLASVVLGEVGLLVAPGSPRADRPSAAMNGGGSCIASSVPGLPYSSTRERADTSSRWTA
jgi:hypothetical protein